MMRRRLGGWIAIFVLACALPFSACTRETGEQPTPEVPYINIYIGNTLHAQLSLADEQTHTVAQSDAMRNEIAVENGSAYMRFATCPNQDCVHQPSLSPETLAAHPLYGWIICLPNQVSLELVVEETP